MEGRIESLNSTTKLYDAFVFKSEMLSWLSPAFLLFRDPKYKILIIKYHFSALLFSSMYYWRKSMYCVKIFSAYFLKNSTYFLINSTYFLQFRTYFVHKKNNQNHQKSSKMNHQKIKQSLKIIKIIIKKQSKHNQKQKIFKTEIKINHQHIHQIIIKSVIKIIIKNNQKQ